MLFSQSCLPLADFIGNSAIAATSRWRGFQPQTGSGLPQNCFPSEFSGANCPLRPQPPLQVSAGRSAPQLVLSARTASSLSWPLLSPARTHVLLPSLLSLGCPSTVLQPASWLISPSAPLPSPVHFCLPFSCPQPRLLSVPGRQKAHIMQVGVTPDSCSPESLCPSPGTVLAPWGFFSNVPPCSTPFS